MKINIIYNDIHLVKKIKSYPILKPFLTPFSTTLCVMKKGMDKNIKDPWKCLSHECGDLGLQLIKTIWQK